MRKIDHKSTSDSLAPLAGAGGIVMTVHSEREPYEALDDLMSVIEALCPTWPPRETTYRIGKFLLQQFSPSLWLQAFVEVHD
jgi:hypothetical protein